MGIPERNIALITSNCPNIIKKIKQPAQYRNINLIRVPSDHPQCWTYISVYIFKHDARFFPKHSRIRSCNSMKMKQERVIGISDRSDRVRI